MAEPKERIRVHAGRGGGPKSDATARAVAEFKGGARSNIEVPGPRTLYEALLSAARDPDVDADKMEKVADLLMKVESNEARKAFRRAFNQMKAVLPEIDMDGNIDHGEGRTAKGNKKLRTMYSTYPNLKRICDPILRAHGFSFNNVIEPSPDGAKINVVGYLGHDDGHEMVSRFPIGNDPSGSKNPAQGWGSASSYGKRYNFILMLDIVSRYPKDLDNDGYKRRDVDTDSQVEVLVSDEQATKVRDAVQSCGVGLEKFCAKFGVESISDLPASKFNDAIKACRNYAQEIEKRTKPAEDDRFPGDH